LKNDIDFNKSGGIIPCIFQDYKTSKVLMLGYMNKEAYEKTLETGNVYYFSRSKNRLWMKGETSGHIQKVKEIFIDCDNDTLLIKGIQEGGAACHEGYNSCFYRKLEGNKFTVIDAKVFDPKDIY
jgi:phosphoribosyl-AMP cyclohydrolase